MIHLNRANQGIVGLLGVWVYAHAQLADPMVASYWTKYPTALFSESATNQLWGPGHACFTKSPDGTEDWIVYHAKISSANNTDRLACTQKFTWTNDSLPDFGTPKGKTAAISAPAGQPGASTFNNPIKSTPSPDPMVYKHTDGYYYGLHTVFINGTGYVSRIDIYRSKNMTDIYSNGSGKTIWTAPTSGWNTADIWAPELHYINNSWYIYYAGAGKTGVLSCAKADPYATTTTDWTSTRLVSNIDDWAIDGTVLQANGNLYFIWSGIDAQNAGVQKLFISKMSSPTNLTGNRATISIPQYTWETQGISSIHDVNEGPYILRHNGKVMCIYSASFCETRYYCLGMLRLAGKEPLTEVNPQSFKDAHGAILKVNTTANFTNITFSLPAANVGRIAAVDVYSVRGDLVRTIFQKATNVGNNIIWDHRDVRGRLVTPGMYVIGLNVGDMKVFTRVFLSS